MLLHRIRYRRFRPGAVGWANPVGSMDAAHFRSRKTAARTRWWWAVCWIWDIEREPGVGKPILDFLVKPGVVAYRYWDEVPQLVKTDNPELLTIVYSLPGKEAITAVVSYSNNDEEVKLKIDAKALGFSSNHTVINAESGEKISLNGNTVSFPLKKHDVRVLRFVVEEK